MSGLLVLHNKLHSNGDYGWDSLYERACVHKGDSLMNKYLFPSPQQGKVYEIKDGGRVI